VRTILIVGGGYAGFYTAWRLTAFDARHAVRRGVFPFHRPVVKGFPAWFRPAADALRS